MKRAERGTRRFGMRIPAIDVVKGLAIIGVIAQHALTRETMDDRARTSGFANPSRSCSS
jgi:peptidoglycan/LPS O-acetylase OafA/YrhL